MTEITLDYVKQLAGQLPVGDRRLLAEHLASDLPNDLESKPVDLYGIWRGKFPDDLDIEKEIREIRDEWKEELEEFGP